MSPTSRSITPRPEGVCLSALLSAVPALAHAQDAAPAAFNTASWVLIFVALCLALALVRHLESHEQVLHNLGTAIAIFGSDRRLEFYNTAYMKL